MWIDLTKGKRTRVDAKDFKSLNQVKWFCLTPGYAARSVRVKSKIYKVLMHRLILKAPKGIEVDHINGDKLDNRRSNLRLCLKKENHRNRGKQKSNTSGYKGVNWHKPSQKWVARIAVNGKRFFLGSFRSRAVAARAYDEAAKKYHGKFANLNF